MTAPTSAAAISPSTCPSPRARRQLAPELLAGRELSLTPEAADPNVRYLALILAELQAVAPAACCDRFRHAVHEYLVRGFACGARNWAADHTPQPETFLGQRIHEGPTTPCCHSLSSPSAVSLTMTR